MLFDPVCVLNHDFHDSIVFLTVFDMDLISCDAAWPNRIKLLMLFDRFPCFASLSRKIFDPDLAFSQRNLIHSDISGSNFFTNISFPLVFWYFEVLSWDLSPRPAEQRIHTIRNLEFDDQPYLISKFDVDGSILDQYQIW